MLYVAPYELLLSLHSFAISHPLSAMHLKRKIIFYNMIKLNRNCTWVQCLSTPQLERNFFAIAYLTHFSPRFFLTAIPDSFNLLSIFFGRIIKLLCPTSRSCRRYFLPGSFRSAFNITPTPTDFNSISFIPLTFRIIPTKMLKWISF